MREKKCPKNVELIHVKYWLVLMDRVVQFHEIFVLKKYLNWFCFILPNNYNVTKISWNRNKAEPVMRCVAISWNSRFENIILHHFPPYSCSCSDGYEGDGKSCKKVIISCNVLDNCSKYAHCLFNIQEKGYRCQCKFLVK